MIFFCGVLVIAVASSHAADDKQRALPVLAAPINATWAANHATQWREMGFRGFLFEGLLDTLDLLPEEVTRQEDDQDSEEAQSSGNTLVLDVPPVPQKSTNVRSPLLIPEEYDSICDEIRGATNRLKAEGIDKNFLHLQLAPDLPWFTDASLLAVAEKRLSTVGKFCQETGLRGIALNTASTALFYDYRWDGYAPDLLRSDIRQGAYRFGLRTMQALLRACPGCEIVVVSEDPRLVGPLWFDVAEGIHNAPGAADDVCVRFIFLLLEPNVDEKTIKNNHRLFTDSLFTRMVRNNPLRDIEIGFGLAPLTYHGDIPIGRMRTDQYRRALHAASLYGYGYVLLWSPEGGWWHIPPDEVEQFTHLKQTGAARVRFSPPVPITVTDFLPIIHGIHNNYIGNIIFGGLKAEAEKNELGMSLLVWEGLPHEWEIEDVSGIVTVTSVSTNEKQLFAPREGSVILPQCDQSVVIEGLPLDDTALSAALKLSLKSPLVTGIVQSRMELSVYNPFNSTLTGNAVISTKERFSLGGSSFLVNLAPGQNTKLNRTIRGISGLGVRPVFTVTFVASAGRSVSRDFTFAVEPEKKFVFFLDGPSAGKPLVYDSDEQGGSSFWLWCDYRGRLGCADLKNSSVLWEKRLAGSYKVSPLLIKKGLQNPLCAVMSEQGRIRMITLQGEEQFEAYLPGEGPFLIARMSFSKKERVIAASGTQVFVYGDEQFAVSTIPLPGVVHYLFADSEMQNLFFAVVYTPAMDVEGGKSSGLPLTTSKKCQQLVAFDASKKNRVWTVDLPCTLSCTPVVLSSTEDSEGALLLGCTTGEVIMVKITDGHPVAKVMIDEKHPVTSICCSRNSETPPQWIAAGLAHDQVFSLNISSDQMELNKPVSLDTLPSALALLPGHTGIAIGTIDGSVYAITFDSKLLWEYHGGTGAIQGITCLVEPEDSSAYQCLIACSDHSVHGLQVRQDLLPESPLVLTFLAPP